MQNYLFTYEQDFHLEAGGKLPGFELAYCTFGKLNADQSNVIWVCHALTGNADVTEWWGGLFGEGKFYNPEDDFVICANILGSCYGSTGPLSTNPKTGKPYYHDFPKLTVRDLVASLEILRQHLGIRQINTLIGGSLGGQQALEWAVEKPDVCENLILVSTNAKHSPWGIAFNEAQRMAIAADPTWITGGEKAGHNGMAAARAAAMLSYRNYDTYRKTQEDPDNEKIGNYKAAAYQQYKGARLGDRFNAYTYWTISEVMDTHNISRGRGNLIETLEKIEAYTHVIGITSDILFPIPEQRLIARWVKNVTYEEINSTYGHDGFLIETEKLRKSFRAFFRQKKKKLLHHSS
ncbi:homoserine O-acetyltransferase [Flammeovirgaceae bacterium SG7u.111]|nr:homoserine O-acetyltransferase [Flammeovirgaceae bacterium SG7u.132]WPO35099.1 homoserine O-acetyltransferase [Flammeovirgaceae bacterium SG7u.111]